MKFAFRIPLALVSLAISACFVATLTGCGSSTAPVPKPTILPAKNMYVIQETYVDDVENDSILTFTTTANGATTPSSTLTLAPGYYAYSIAVGPTGKIYVGAEYEDDPSEVMVFAAGASGAATPLTVYTGGTPGSFDYADYMTVNDQGQLFIMSDDESIEVYAANATGGDLPTQYITTYYNSDDFSYGIGADHAGNIYLTSDRNDEVDVISAGATGNAAIARSITSTDNYSFTEVGGITADAAGDVIVANYNSDDDPFREVAPVHAHRNSHLRHNLQSHFHHTNGVPHNDGSAPTAIFVFAAGASGAASPTSTITGSATTVNEPEDLATDGLTNIYYADNEGGSPTLMMFPTGATGNVAPNSSMTSTSYTDSWEYELSAF